MKQTCVSGHTFYGSDSQRCPICEKVKAPGSEFLASLSNPARNALLHHGIDTLEKLSGFTEKEILKIHGLGKASLPALRKSLAVHGLTFSKNTKGDH